MVDEAIVGYLGPPQKAVGPLRPAAIPGFYNVKRYNAGVRYIYGVQGTVI